MNKKTVDFEHAHYSKDLIRKLEDPAYAKAAEEYERQARAARQSGQKQKEEPRPAHKPNQSFTYDDYMSSRVGKHGKHGKHSRNALPNVREVATGRKAAPKAVRTARAPRKRQPRGKRLKRVLALIGVLVIALLVFAGYNFWKITSHLDRVDTDDKNFAIDAGVADSLSGYRNIAILGSDARKGEGYEGSRTDAILVLSINKKTKESRLISVMRDSYLKIEGSDGELTLDKVTHAHAFGGGMDTTRALNRNLDLNIQEYVVFNWKAVADTVDTLGGIEVDVKKKELKDLNHYGKETGKNVGKKFHKVKHAGVQTLDGVQATTYCRIRKNSGGDTGRAKRYKKVVEGVMKKAVTQPWKADELAETVMPQIRTNMSRMQLSTLMLKMRGMDMKKGIAWPKSYYGGIVGGVWYAVPTTLNSNVKKLHKKAFAQEDYKPSKTVRKISKQIVNETGIS
ncbi:LCP family protein [Eubacterium sp. AB3007]|uniref:LCP family protein n=1 Tax=Eubacterium sp. AB3007 TaxID=1392487 RepID=UPI0004841BA3|nr:LCP family protein [Eubacterium sp. AB3007]